MSSMGYTSQALGISAFDVYTVELPVQAQTVQHDHLDDGVENLYFIAICAPTR